MPYRRTYRRRAPVRRRRRYARRTRGKKYNRAIVRNPQTPFPDVMFTKMKYSQHIATGSFTTSPNLRVFAGNGMYDPDITGAGHQPYGFDEYATLYFRYQVRASKIKIIPGPTDGIFLTVRPSTTSGTVLTIAEAMERPNSKTVTFGGDSASHNTFIQHYWKTSKALGRKCRLDDDDTSADYNANPTKLWYWAINQINTDQSTSTSDNMMVEITYYVAWYKRRTYTQS